MFQKSGKLIRKTMRITGCFIIVSLFIISFNVNAYPESWTAKPLTDQPKELHEAPSIAVSEKNVHVVWNTWHNEFDSKIYYRSSNDNGKTWGETICLTPNSTTAIYPVIAANNDIIHIAWKDYREGNPEIYYKRSMDNGKTWSDVKRITYNSTRKNNIYDIGIAVKGNNVYLVWKDYRSGSSEIFFKKSIDNGKTWGEDQRLTYDYTPSYSPYMAVNDENIYIVWEEWGKRSDICFIRSNNSGENWSEKKYLTNTTKGDSQYPSLAGWENNVYLVWQDTRTGNSEIYFKKSMDYGKTWGETRQITDNTTVRFNPKIQVYGNKITIVGQGRHGEKYIIWYMTSDDNGESWSDPINLTDGDVDAYDVNMVVQSYDIYSVWQKYYEAGWTDIWFMSNYNEKKPVVTSLSVSNTSFIYPSKVDIIVDGYDPIYNKSDITCIVEYKSPSLEWYSIPAVFKDDHWEAYLSFSKNSQSGGYIIRAKLVNPSGEESEWSASKSINVEISEPNSDVPSLNLYFLVSSLVIIAILMKVRKHEKK